MLLRGVLCVLPLLSATALTLYLNGATQPAVIVELFAADVIWVSIVTISLVVNRRGLGIISTWKLIFVDAIPIVVRRLVSNEIAALLSVTRTALRLPARVPRRAYVLRPPKTGVVLPIFLGMLVVEGGILHVVFSRWPVAQAVLAFLHIYAVIFALGLLALPKQFPHYVDGQTLILRSGHRLATKFDFSQVESVQQVMDISTLTDSVEGGVARFPGPDGCSIAIRLKEPVTCSLTGIFQTTTQEVTEVRLASRDSEAVEELLRFTQK
ncbi:hypothetical protein F8O07_09270 [Pseudoclavibacter sp. CFCC 13796]|uniref:hypothetical protein n=1 Tax=Pseudoclavibacter sp. CFCC 13796 TaxID=2615179 RepID=UPI0013015373|nr:hypothetical protein [Pseudoclavibacter sp. CFCC 13796]KAB1659780.1 hypothetical protein F8O07_09270 [Pseudoclavibacter sp. CFCC 13796]